MYLYNVRLYLYPLVVTRDGGSVAISTGLCSCRGKKGKRKRVNLVMHFTHTHTHTYQSRHIINGPSEAPPT